MNLKKRVLKDFIAITFKTVTSKESQKKSVESFFTITTFLLMVFRISKKECWKHAWNNLLMQGYPENLKKKECWKSGLQGCVGFRPPLWISKKECWKLSSLILSLILSQNLKKRVLKDRLYCLIIIFLEESQKKSVERNRNNDTWLL